MPERIKNFAFTSLIWDWNGTLLNDLEFCVQTINSLLKKRGLPLMTNGKYREVFSFPVKDYYKKIGFDFSKEDFSIPAKEFIDRYNANIHQCDLHPGVIRVLEYFKQQNTRQFILSAMKQDMLDQTISQNSISGYFEKVLGLDDHYAVSKIEQGKLLLKNWALNKTEVCIVGDTLHDFEVAEELGINCILIADGHQSKQRLQKSGSPVLNSLSELLGIVNGK